MKFTPLEKAVVETALKNLILDEEERKLSEAEAKQVSIIAPELVIFTANEIIDRLKK